MTPWWFLLFATICVVQRIGEIRQHDMRLRRRRPHWTVVAMIVAHAAIGAGALGEAFGRGSGAQAGSIAVGGLLFLAGLLLRRWVIATLRELWSIDIDFVDQHRLITDGPFAWCRHPNYLAILLEMSGYCILGQAWLTLLLGLPLYGLVIAARIVCEERQLIATFGTDYLEYRRRRCALCPWARPRWLPILGR